MIHERLAEQIMCLENENDSTAKILILRLVSIADMFNLKISTKNLLRFVEHNIGFNTDKGSILNSLKSEYHIQLEDNFWVVGLHPVKAGYLQRWFERFGLRLDILRGVTSNDLEQAMKEHSIEILGEILRSVYTSKPDVYMEFYEKNKDELLNRLQVETETLTADIKNLSLLLRYIVNTGKKNQRTKCKPCRSFCKLFTSYRTIRYCGFILPYPIDFSLFEIRRFNFKHHTIGVASI